MVCKSVYQGVRVVLQAADDEGGRSILDASSGSGSTAGIRTVTALSRMLLVDDSQESRELIMLLLARQPLVIDEAGNGREALELFERNGYDLVLMDIQMPLMDGYSATRMIRASEADRGNSRTPVVALTAHACEDDVLRCKEAGCDDHIAKPFKKKALLQCLARYLPGIEHG